MRKHEWVKVWNHLTEEQAQDHAKAAALACSLAFVHDRAVLMQLARYGRPPGHWSAREVTFPPPEGAYTERTIPTSLTPGQTVCLLTIKEYRLIGKDTKEEHTI